MTQFTGIANPNKQGIEHIAHDIDSKTHYYRIGLYSRPFVPAGFGPGTIGGFCPGSNG